MTACFGNIMVIFRPTITKKLYTVLESIYFCTNGRPENAVLRPKHVALE
jgi:hypothetical protein